MYLVPARDSDGAVAGSEVWLTSLRCSGSSSSDTFSRSSGIPAAPSSFRCPTPNEGEYSAVAPGSQGSRATSVIRAGRKLAGAKSTSGCAIHIQVDGSAFYALSLASLARTF